MSPRRETPIKTTVYISPGLYRWFKHYGFDEGETLASLVERAMTEFAKQHGYVPEEEPPSDDIRGNRSATKEK